jgi:GntR family transcriptional regulator/MocR family aminotransferase
MVLPGALAGAIADERGWADGGSPALDQLALASFIDRGELDRHLRRMRLRYRRRRDRLVAAPRQAPARRRGRRRRGRPARHRRAGPEADVDAVVARASARGVGVFATFHAGRPLLLVGYANIAEEAIDRAVRRAGRCDTRVACAGCSSTSSSRSTAQSTARRRCAPPRSSPARSTRA